VIDLVEDTMRNTVKSAASVILDKVYLAGARILYMTSGGKCTCEDISEKHALDCLRNYGYELKSLWGKPLPSLKDDSLDLSVIIPVYNTERFLAKCLDSILLQKTIYHYEIICIDDGSTDGSSELLQRYAREHGDKIRIISQKNSGISVARNKALVEAKGEYVGFIDSDDWISDDYITVMMDRARETGAEIIQSRFITIKRDGYILSEKNLGECVIDADDFQQIFRHVSGCMGGKLFKKTLFREVRCPERFIYEDMVTRMCLVHLCSGVAFTGKASYYYVRHDTNLTRIAGKSNVKSIDQYWLAKSLSDFAMDSLKIDTSDIYCILLKEWSPLMYERTRRLPGDVRDALFFLCRNYLMDRFDSAGTPSEKHYRIVHNAFQTCNYKLYRLVSKSLYYHLKTI